MKTVIAVVVVIILALTAAWAFMRPAPNPGLDAFARCLTDKGAVMYGAYWCPHCQSEKRTFGSSFKFVNYVECTKETNRCLAAEIDGYPTWTFPDPSAGAGQVRKLEGELGLAKLSEISGCPLP